MKNVFLLCACVLLLVNCQNEPGAMEICLKKGKPSLIPAVQNMSLGENSFSFNQATKIHFPEGLNREAIFKSEVSAIQHSLSSNSKTNQVYFKIKKDLKGGLEAYQLKISQKSIEISGNSEIGLFWGLQSFKQLCFQYLDANTGQSQIPELSLKDQPKFEHRGMLLDVCRHFFNKEVVKKYIELLSYYKMNILHWHLTEDQGWRIEIDGYPRLTEISAWRKDSSGEKYGGFYSKKDIREIVQYAIDRNITIIPEIELPGHSQAAIAAYPHLSCTGDSVNVVNDWGVFKEIYCAGNDSTFIFIENVLLEVMDLFPSKYIHIGGDEAPKYRWEHCAKCQNRIREEELKDEHELQSYFITRIEKFLNKNGRDLIGWDEILEGGLSPNATVQSWRGMEHGKTAAEQDHKVIMSPTSHSYFDYDLSSIDLQKVYSFDPIPENLDISKHRFILGGECNLWSEHIPNEKNLDSKVFPRILAMSEVLWNYPQERNFDLFYQRVQDQYPFLKSKNVEYGLESVSAAINPWYLKGKTKIDLQPGLPNLELSFRKNNSDPFLNYQRPIPLNFSGILQVQAKKNDKNYGPILNQEIKAHKALNSKPSYSSHYNAWYDAGGDRALVNGFLGSLNFRDGNWQGFFGEDLEIILELDSKTTLSDVWLNFYQYNNAWIFLPLKVQVFSSLDGKVWEKQAQKKLEDKSKIRGKFIEPVHLLIYPETDTKFLKLKVKNLGIVPNWHEAAGSKAWIFIDEIIVH